MQGDWDEGWGLGAIVPILKKWYIFIFIYFQSYSILTIYILQWIPFHRTRNTSMLMCVRAWCPLSSVLDMVHSSCCTFVDTSMQQGGSNTLPIRVSFISKQRGGLTPLVCVSFQRGECQPSLFGFIISLTSDEEGSTPSLFDSLSHF